MTLPPAYTLVALDRVDSTNDEAKRRAGAGAPEGTLVWARSQSAGRGRRGRRWDSPEGNLYLSLILRPDCPVGEAARLSFVAAVALAEALATLVPPLTEITNKWPNDVLVNGRKCAGILLESSLRNDRDLDWLVLGVGVNLVSHPEDPERPATDLAFEGAGEIAPETALHAFARHFLRWSDRWLEDGFAPVRAAWLRRAHGLGQPVTVRLGGESFTAIFRDLADDGALLAELADGRLRRVEAGEVFPVIA